MTPSNQQQCAEEISMIVKAETGEAIETGEHPASFYPKLAKAMQQMRAELLSYRAGRQDNRSGGC